MLGNGLAECTGSRLVVADTQPIGAEHQRKEGRTAHEQFALMREHQRKPPDDLVEVPVARIDRAFGQYRHPPLTRVVEHSPAQHGLAKERGSVHRQALLEGRVEDETQFPAVCLDAHLRQAH